MDRESTRRIAERQHGHKSHTRSISPTRTRSSHRDQYRDRTPNRRQHRSSRSPAHDSKHGDKHRERKRHHHRERRELSPVSAAPPVLPYNARQLSKRDISQLKPMFAMYLDIQKGLLIEDMDDQEVMGRWKSFIKKWNRGELAEGWYDPATFEKAKGSLDDMQNAHNHDMNKSLDQFEQFGDSDTMFNNRGDVPEAEIDDDNGDDEEDYGPKLPSGTVTSRGPLSGPTIPDIQDLELRREQALADAETARSEARTRYKQETLSHKTHLRAFEDEVAPRAEPGTHERKMEKKREKAAANRDFASGRRGGSPAMDAAPDSELMGGGGDDDLSALKRAKEQEARKKNERELRREEILRARKAEREERLAEYKKKEEETMAWLKALAKQRFG